jgi:hypothetical protein
VSEDLDWLPAATAEGGKVLRSAVNGAGGAIGKAGNGVSEEFSFLIHGEQYISLGESAGGRQTHGRRDQPEAATCEQLGNSRYFLNRFYTPVQLGFWLASLLKSRF